VAGEDVSQIDGGGQGVQDFALGGGEGVAGEAAGGGHLRVWSVHRPAVVVAADGADAEFGQEIEGFARPERAGDPVAEVEDVVHAAGGDVGEDGFQGEEVAVDVGDDGEAHSVDSFRGTACLRTRSGE
jgi:hypothetical protein